MAGFLGSIALNKDFALDTWGHDKVVVEGGQICWIIGLRTSGYFALRTLNNNTLLNPNYRKLRLLERASGLIMVPSASSTS